MQHRNSCLPPQHCVWKPELDFHHGRQVHRIGRRKHREGRYAELILWIALFVGPHEELLYLRHHLSVSDFVVFLLHAFDERRRKQPVAIARFKHRLVVITRREGALLGDTG
jgi:hypothetical protein